MFTDNTLPLWEFAEQFGITVRRNCDFSYVGKIPTRLPRRLVPCTTPLHIEQATASDGIAGIVTLEALAHSVPNTLGLAISANPIQSALAMQSHIAAIDGFQWKCFKSQVHHTAVIYSGAYVSPHDVVIGEGTIVYPNAVILPRTFIGRHCSIGPGTVISNDAFEVDISSAPYKITRQSGGVYIADDVDIQAKCTIVRSTFGGFTELGEGTKLDCHVHFAHDCKAGKNVRIAACAEISGRVYIGDEAFIGPNASISNGLVIGHNSKVTIGAVVTRDVPDGETVTGNFAVSHKKWLSFMRKLK